MSDSDMLFVAIRNQRWYFFENNEKIIFDKNSGLIWANLKFFPYKKEGNNPYSLKEAASLVTQMNLQNWGGYGSWKIPTPYELWIMIEDKSFPFRQGNFWRIKSEFYGWCVNVNGSLKAKDLDFTGAYKGITNDRYVDVILCTDALRPTNFSSEPNVIIDIFRKNNLFPKFNNVIANRIYSTVKLSTNSKTAAPEKSISPAAFDFDFDFTKYDAASINQSPIKFFKAVSSVADEMLELLQQYEDFAAKIIADAAQISSTINTSYINNPQLAPNENNLFAERKRILANLLTFGTDDAKAQILLMKSQAENFAANINAINHSQTSLLELAEIENSPRVSFEFLTENLAQILNDTQDKLIFFTENETLIKAIIDALENWSADYFSFKQNRREFENFCRQNRIEENIYRAWYSDWLNLRFNIEEKFLPLVQFALKENLGNTTLDILERLNEYKKAVDNFYFNENNIKRRLEVEENPRKFAQKFADDLQKIIDACEKITERIFLKNWAESLIN